VEETIFEIASVISTESPLLAESSEMAFEAEGGRDYKPCFQYLFFKI
jgi:hypothetical protein